MNDTKFLDETNGTISVPLFKGCTITFSIPAVNLMAFVQRHYDEIVYISENSPDAIVNKADEIALKIISKQQNAATNENETKNEEA